MHSINVGYQSTACVKDQFYMCAVQFDDVGGEGQGTRLCDLVAGNIPYGSQIQILDSNGTTYTIYKYLQEVYDSELDDFVPGWGDGSEDKAILKIAPGTAFWFKATADCNVTIAGQVLADSETVITLTGGQFSMIANPFPVAVNPNDVAWTGLTYGDQIQVLNSNGTTYSIYKYLEEAYDAEKDDFLPGWGDGSEDMVSTGVILAGQGAWINPKSTVTAKFVSPLE